MTVLPYKGVSIFNEDGTYRKEDDVVQGRSYSSNLTKLLKQLPKLQNMQQGKPASPVMAHMSLTNYCNLTCSFCCFANRDISEKMPTEKVFQALESFKAIGVTGVEFTGGGEPSITVVEDMPQDQGGYVGIQFSGSHYDGNSNVYDVTHYSIWRELDTDGSSSAVENQTHTVYAGSMYYNPSSIEINAGDTVQFINEGGYHDVEVTVGPELLSLGACSGPCTIGELVFNTPGDYEYICSIGNHASQGMIGSIIVNELQQTTQSTSYDDMYLFLINLYINDNKIFLRNN